MEYLCELPYTFILYESPYRILKCLREINQHCGPDRLVCVAREISKMHEEVIQMQASDLLHNFEERQSIKGEFVVIVAGKK